MTMNIYRIYPSADSDEHVCCTMADGPVEALEMTKTVACVECFFDEYGLGGKGRGIKNPPVL